MPKKNDFNFKVPFDSILKEEKFSEIENIITKFRYVLKEEYKKKAKSKKDNEYNLRIYAAEELFFEPILNFYSDLKEQVNSDTVPEYIQNFDYYEFSETKIREFLEDKELSDKTRKAYFDWFSFVANIHINCYDLFKIKKTKRDNIKSVLDSIKNFLEYKFPNIFEITETKTIEATKLNDDDKKIEIFVKGIKRENRDGKTILPEEETVILFKFLVDWKIFLKEKENADLTNIAKALSVLTGFSQKSLRISLSKKFNEEKNNQVVDKIQELINKFKKKYKLNKENNDKS